MRMEEIWKEIKGYPGYKISNKGSVLSLNYGRTNKAKLLKNNKRGSYLYVGLVKNKVSKNFSVHRLVAEAFIPNPDNKSQVNHIDEDSFNNLVENLEWVTPKENANHGTRNERCSRARVVQQLSLDGELINEFESCVVAAECTGLKKGQISATARGKQHTSGGFIWKYKKPFPG